MVAPSFVTVISPVEVEWRILFIPFGPKVDLTRSPSARAPTKDERRACYIRGVGIVNVCVRGLGRELKGTGAESRKKGE